MLFGSAIAALEQIGYKGENARISRERGPECYEYKQQLDRNKSPKLAIFRLALELQNQIRYSSGTEDIEQFKNKPIFSG